MGPPARHLIEKFANEAYAVARGRILKEYTKKKSQALTEVRRTGNSGGYVPAFTRWGVERTQAMILARADAWVEAFTLHRAPADLKAEQDLRKNAQLEVAGTISGIRGEIDLLKKRTGLPLNSRGHLSREVRKAMTTALAEAVLKLKAQRDAHRSDANSVSQPLPEEERLENEKRPKSTGRRRTKAEALVLGTIGFPRGTPPRRTFSSLPEARQLIEEYPELTPWVNQIDQFERATAEAKVAFRQSELTERWGAWSGLHPWIDRLDLETTECPWWIAGADYVFRVASAWRTHSPSTPDRTDAALSIQVKQTATWVYWNRVLLHDAVHAPNSKAENLLTEKNAKRFATFAFLFCLRRFAEEDLEAWRRRATSLSGAQDSGVSVREPRQDVNPPPNARKGDRTLLGEKELVTFKTAELYLGITERQRQNLVKNGALSVEGQGHSRKITVESLKKYLPPEIPK
jgi:hypothetical protein